MMGMGIALLLLRFRHSPNGFRFAATSPYCVIALFSSMSLADEVSVDLGSPQGEVTHRACGFLHGITATSPDDALLVPLKIRYIRGWPEPLYSMPGLFELNVYARVSRPDLRLAIGMGTLYYGHAVKQSPEYVPAQYGAWKMEHPGEKGNWKPWERIVTQLVRETVEKKIRCDWVIWNEPDHRKFWAVDTNRYYETFDRAYTIIKAIDTEAVVTGPTAAVYSFAYLTSFLKYCKAHGCVPDILTWHELTRTVPDIKGHVEEIRAWCRANDIPIKGIVIDEYGGKGTQHLPGAMVGFISALEAAGVDAAARAIWGKPGTLCGATTEDGHQPLGVWWVYKAYSDMSGRLIQTTETESVRLLASKDGTKKEVRLMVGNQTDQPRQVCVTLTNVKKPLFLVTAKRICNTGDQALDSPTTMSEVRIEPLANGNRINLGSLAAWEAAELVISIKE